MDALAMPWANARAAHLLAVRRMAPVKVGDDREEGYNANQEGFMMHTQKVETLEPFSSHVIPMKMTEAYLGECLNIMVQALYIQDGTLPPGLTMQNTYTELRKGSKKSGSGSMEPHHLSPNSSEEDSSGVGNTPTVTTQNPQAWESTSSRQSVSRPSNSKVND